MIASVAVRATWASGPPKVITIPGVNGFQSANLRVGASEVSGTALGGGGAAAAAFGVVLCVALSLATRGPTRRSLAVLGVALSAVAVVALYVGAGGVRARAERRGFAHPSVHRAAVVATYGGVWIALAGTALFADAVRRGAGEARLPERAPEPVDE